MAANQNRNVAYKPQTIYRDVLTAADKRLKKVCTVWPMETTVPHSAFGTHATIPGCPGEDATPQAGAFFVDSNGERKLTNRYGFTLAPSGVEQQDMGGCVTLGIRSITSRRIAMDVIGLSEAGTEMVNGQTISLCPPVRTSPMFEKGYFVPEGDDPTEQELDQAEDRREQFLNAAIQKGQRIWMQTKNMNLIPPEALIAANFKGEAGLEWAPKVSKTRVKQVTCPICTERIPAGARKHCDEWLDYDADGNVFAINDPARKARLVNEKVTTRGAKSAPDASSGTE